jgi:hypothetical protein
MPFTANCAGASLLKRPRPRRNVEFTISPRPRGNTHVLKRLLLKRPRTPHESLSLTERWPGRPFHERLRKALLWVEEDNLASLYQEKCTAEIRQVLDALAAMSGFSRIGHSSRCGSRCGALCRQAQAEIARNLKKPKISYIYISIIGKEVLDPRKKAE